ncbi:cordon-bleu protein-like 1b isoform X3 [Denticeps clupeoides]|uniref:Cordon-bleu ubiquitin-like domain-containing protein n=1 Tax=Denticeps clupeoides TaxID=299321 RepID=A0AAY4BI99_9TELE|nr:cordon-bleu protein-like 1 isoform X3 [Denticeps clupeoides]
MDEPGLEEGSPRRRAPHARRSSKSKAPPPPPAVTGLDGTPCCSRVPGYPHMGMEQEENLLDRDLTLVVVLPEGVEKTAVVHGSQPVMDLLVMLCAKYHLNPSAHTVELISANRNHIKYKPNSLMGTLEAEKVLIKPKGCEDKNRKAVPQMPEVTVRLVINYKKTQKTILRVSPKVPLGELLRGICEKCEFDWRTTILLRDVHSEEPLDLNCSLNDYEIRELYAMPTKVSSPKDFPPSPTHSDPHSPGRDRSERENRGLLGMFRKSRKKPDQATAASAPVSPVLRRQRPVSMSSLCTQSPTYNSNTMPSDVPKKRRAPLPPGMLSQSVPSDLGDSHLEAQHDGNQDRAALGRGSSSESSLRKTKRKAPPPPVPPAATSPSEAQSERSSTGAPLQDTLEGIEEQEETGPPDTCHSPDGDSGSLDLSVDSGRPGAASPSCDADMLSLATCEDAGEDRSCDLSSHGDSLADASGRDEEFGDQTANAGMQVDLHHDEDGFAGQPKEPGQDGSPEAVSTTQEASVAPTQAETGTQTAGGANAESSPRGLDHLPPPPAGSSSPDLPAPGPAGLKRDMATSTEELRALGSGPVDRRYPAATSVKGGPVYFTEAEPKPKPSNELTRDYIPKVGMTTYTIVPQKSLEKLRFFEVELTLEAPAIPAGTERAATSPDQVSTGAKAVGSLAKNCASAPPPGSAVELRSSPHRPDLPPPPPPPAATPPASATTEELVQAGSTAAEVKEKKVPPATKPKPASFRLPQHKRTPGFYVTSAAEKDPGSPTKVQSPRAAGEADGSVPLPPPPVFVEEDEARGPKRSPAEAGGPPASPSLSLEKLRSFAAPRPYTPAVTSRFAQAVSSAVKRSQSLGHAPAIQSAHKVPFHSLSDHSPVTELSPPFKSKAMDNGETGEKSPGLRGGSVFATCPSTEALRSSAVVVPVPCPSVMVMEGSASLPTANEE